MKTERFEIARLRGMDQRWRVSADSAQEIKEMSWDDYDGWRQSGAYDLVTGSSFDWGSVKEITSIHFLVRHNGSQRFVLFETGKGQLARLAPFKFNDSSVDPFDFLQDLEGKPFNGVESSSSRKRFVPSTSSIGSQSVAFGGRLYLVNGSDEPSVFDGRFVSPAGFAAAPSAPSATVVFRDFYNEAAEDEDINETRYFLGTRVRGQGLGSLKPKGVKTNKSNFLDAKLCGYQYRVSFVNSRGQESPLSDPSDICQFECADGFKRYVALSLPIGGPNVVARRIYRTRDIYDDFGNPITAEVGRNFFFLKEVQDNESNVIEDGISDSNLGSIRDPEDFGPFPAQGRFITAFKNTLFIAGMPDNRIRFSAPGTPEVFPEGNVFDIGDAEAGDITGLYSTTNALVVFKEHGIFFIKGDARSGFFVQTLTRDIGCIAPNSIKDVPNTGLVFLSSNGVFVLKGMLEDTNDATVVVKLSTPIKDLVDRICYSGAGSAVGTIDRINKEYWLCVPTIGKKNNLLLVWHYTIGSWSFRENYPIQCSTEVRGRVPYVLFGSHDLVNSPGVHVFSNFFRIKNEFGSGSATLDLDQDGKPDSLYTATTDFPVYETAPISFSSVFSAVQVAYINLYAVAYGDEQIKTNFRVNRSYLDCLDENKGRKQQHTDNSERQPVYGNSGSTFQKIARFDNGDTFGFHRPVVIRFDVSHMHKALTTEFAIRFLQDAKNVLPNRMMIVGWSVDVKTGEQRSIRSLTDVLASDKR